jgi:hypothetical protein
MSCIVASSLHLSINATVSQEMWVQLRQLDHHLDLIINRRHFSNFLIVPLKLWYVNPTNYRSKIRSTLCPDLMKIVSADGHRSRSTGSPPYGSPNKTGPLPVGSSPQRHQQIREKCLSGWLHLDYRGEQCIQIFYLYSKHEFKNN